ncbi:MAG: hypothetical protein HC929_19625 [Leptolyngbyaceae cyanobacterium SM2_5_2]|nr:hypothetical protein [Leptolyngbyaceae cyanobacterium SM2_5_2]
MTQPTQSPGLFLDSSMTAESDFLASLTNPHAPYPWQPLSPEAEAYFTAAAAELDDPLVETSIAAGWQNFSAQLSAHWDGLAATAGVAQVLTAEFQERIPLHLLQAIALPPQRWPAAASRF